VRGVEHFVPVGQNHFETEYVQILTVAMLQRDGVCLGRTAIAHCYDPVGGCCGQFPLVSPPVPGGDIGFDDDFLLVDWDVFEKNLRGSSGEPAFLNLNQIMALWVRLKSAILN
jgi:hypothetical protein